MISGNPKSSSRSKFPQFLLAIFSLIIPLLGLIAGAYHIFKNKRLIFGSMLIVFTLLPSGTCIGVLMDSSSDTIPNTQVETVKPAAKPKPTSTPSLSAVLLSRFGVKNETRAIRICREFRTMLAGVHEGTDSYSESRTIMKKMHTLADSSISDRIRGPVTDMLSAWTQGDDDRWLDAMEELVPICGVVNNWQ